MSKVIINISILIILITMISNWQWRWCSVLQVPLTVWITRNVTSYLKMSVLTRPTAASPRPPAESSVNCAQVSLTGEFISVKGFTWFICDVHQHPRYFNQKNNRTISPIICLSNIYEWMNELICLFNWNFITVALAPTKPVVTGTTEAMMVPTKAPVSESATGDQTDQATTEAVSMEPSQAGSEQPSSEVVSMPTKPAASVATTTSKEEYFVVFIYAWCGYTVVCVF